MPKITHKIHHRMIAHAKLEAPHECCGLLAGAEGIITQSYSIQNLPSDDPRIADLSLPSDRRVRYMMDPAEQFRAIRDMREKSLMMMGVYHSHPHSAAYPSSTDIRLAFYSDVFYLIVSLAQKNPDLRAFSIIDQKITEEKVEIVPTRR